MKSQQALENFKTMNCAQSVLAVFASDFNLDNATALRISAGFGGGMGEGETCGAVTGAYMVIGLKVQAGDKTLQEMKDETKARVKCFNELFREKHGSLLCKELLGVNTSTPEGMATACEEDLFNRVCPRFIESACLILEHGL